MGKIVQENKGCFAEIQNADIKRSSLNMRIMPANPGTKEKIVDYK